MREKELIRQTGHVIIGIILIIILKKAITTGIIISAALIVIFAASSKIKTKKIREIKKRFTREEHDKGIYYYLTAFIITPIIFDEKTSLTALSIMVIGDATATIIGKNRGKKKITKEKTLAGSTALLITSLTITLMTGQKPLTAIIISLAATITEIISKKETDNLTIPIITGTIMKIIK